MEKYTFKDSCQTKSPFGWSEIDKGKNETGEIYNTRNPFIRFLATRFLKQIENILEEIQAFQLQGLDLGCAEGNMASHLFGKGLIKSIVLVDNDFQKAVSGQLLFPVMGVVLADAEQLGLRNDAFDYILAMEILEHLCCPEKSLQEIVRILRKDGVLIISVPHEPFFQIGNFLRGRHLNRMGKTPSHIHFWNRTQFRKLLKRWFRIEHEYHLQTFPWSVYVARKYNSRSVQG